jgi:hypothetical protein
MSPQGSQYDDAPVRTSSPGVRSPSPGVRRTMTSLSKSALTKSQIQVKPASGILTRTISDVSPRKAPSPPPAVPNVPPLPALLTTNVMRSSLSQRRRKETSPRSEEAPEMETFQFVAVKKTEEVADLRRRVVFLESRLEELQDTVRVCERSLWG